MWQMKECAPFAQRMSPTGVIARDASDALEEKARSATNLDESSSLASAE